MSKSIEVVRTEKYVYDGRQYDTLVAAEAAKACAEQSKAEKWLERDRNRGYGAPQPDLNEYGVWKVTGEDPNCDMGGYHHEPHLGTVEGTFRQAVEWAVLQKNFFAWGGGGSIVRAAKVIKL